MKSDGDDYPVHGRCNAKTRSGGLCRNRPVTGRARCRMHGGKSLAGKAHGKYTTGLHTAEAKADRGYLAKLLRDASATLKELAG